MLTDSLRTLCACSFALCLLAACGGGGGGDGGDDTPPPTGNPPPSQPPSDPPPAPPPPALNGGLSGKLYFAQPGDFVEFDLATSVRTLVRADNGSLTPSDDGQEFVATDDPLSGSNDTEDLLILDRDGAAEVRIEREEFFSGQPKLSPDKQRIVVGWPSLKQASVFARNGDLLAQLGDDFSGWEWLPDGRLLVTKADSIFIVDAALSKLTLLKQFPGDTPLFPSVSPDGQQLAFTLGDSGTLKNHVFVMKLDGSGLRQLTTSASNEDGAAWSPDGNWIIVRQGIAYSAIGSGTPGAGCPELWAVPAAADRANLAGTPTGGAFKLQEIEDGKPRSVCAFSVAEWRASPTSLATADGTAPSGGGLNSGLGGRLFFDGFISAGDDSGGFVDLSVNDGIGKLLPLQPGLSSADVSALYVTRDAGEMSYHQSKPDSGNNDYEQITLQTLAGARTARFEVLDTVSGSPKISPDGQRIAIEWHSIDAGDAGGVPIVTVFDRSGKVLARWKNADEWDWLPDGRLLLAVRNQLFVSNAALSQASKILDLADDIGGLAASPDGARIAFSMAGHLWTLNTDGSGLKRMTRARQTVDSPAWSPDGRYLALRLDAGCSEVHVIPADGERVSVGDPLVSSSSLELQEIEDGKARNVCASSALLWR
jgi:Tol biopolymer transport system component